MSRSAPHPLPTRSRSIVSRRSRERRDNIENNLADLAFLPPQSQSPTNRKRVLEYQSSAFLNVDEQLPKRHRLFVDDAAANSPRLAALAAMSTIPPLHRTLSDNSPYLNHTPLPREPVFVRSLSAEVSRKTDPSRVGFESDDADDEKEPSNTASTLCSAFVPPAIDSHLLETTSADDILIVIDSSSPELQPVDLEQRQSYENDLFGSDTTLTCPEDDSEEEDDDARTSQPSDPLQPSASPPPSPPAHVIAVVIPSRPTTVPGPVRRRGPGRPRKVTLPHTTQGEPSTRRQRVKRDHANTTPRTKQPTLRKPKEQNASSSSSTSSSSSASASASSSLATATASSSLATASALASATSTSTSAQMPEPVAESSCSSKVSGSLMSRVLDGAKQASELLDSDLDVSDAATLPECKQLAKSLEMLREHIQPRPDQEPVVPVVPSDGNKAILLDADTTTSLIEIVLAVNQLAAATAVENPTNQDTPCPGPSVNNAFVMPPPCTGPSMNNASVVPTPCVGPSENKASVVPTPCPGRSVTNAFAVPALPTERLTRPHATHTDPRIGTSKNTRPTERLTRPRATHTDPLLGTSRHTIGRFTRPLRRNGPRPFAPRTCREIMTQHPSHSKRSNVSALKTMLKHSLEQAMRKVLSADAGSGVATFESESPTVGTWEHQSWMSAIGNGKGLFRAQEDPIAERQGMVATAHHEPASASTLETQPWMSAIGNGKALFSASLRKEEKERRIAERREIMACMYQTLDFSPPPENWDRSSIILTHGLTSQDHPLLRIDVRSRFGCDYCKKTYKHKNGLAYHMERCPMARLQTSIADDMDGDSTDSETEEQRKARCPTTSLQDMTTLTNNGACSSEGEDEDVDDEEGVIMCVCGSREDEGGMIQCDKCKVWLHLECVDLTENDVPDDFFCPPCQGLPTPSSGGKSFRHFPNKAMRGTNARKFARRARNTGSQDSEEDADTTNEERSESVGDDSGLSTNLLGSPQVTLNHAWEQPKGTVFKERHAPALMLDGSLSQEISTDLPNDLRYNDIGLDNMTGMEFTGAGMDFTGSEDVLMPTELDLSFHDSQGFGYLPPTDPLFEPEYASLISEASIDSDGLRTPIDLPDMAFSTMWPGQDLEGFVEETAEGFHLEHHQPHQRRQNHEKEAQPSGQPAVLLANILTDWYYDPAPPRDDDFDPEGLVDLEACL